MEARDIIGSLLSVMGQFSADEFEQAYRFKKTPGHEMMRPGDVAHAFDRAIEEGWQYLAYTAQEPAAPTDVDGE